jgi:hypothetical protein
MHPPPNHGEDCASARGLTMVAWGKSVCLYPRNTALEDSARRHSSYSARPETGRNGLPTTVRFADERLASRKLEGSGFRNGIGHQWRTRRAKCRGTRCAGLIVSSTVLGEFREKVGSNGNR